MSKRNKGLIFLFLIFIIVFSAFVPEQYHFNDKTLFMIVRAVIIVPLVILLATNMKNSLFSKAVLTGFIMCAIGDISLYKTEILGILMFMAFQCMVVLNFIPKDKRKLFIIVIMVLNIIVVLISIHTKNSTFLKIYYGVLVIWNMFTAIKCNHNEKKRMCEKRNSRYFLAASILFLAGDLQVLYESINGYIPYTSLINNFLYYFSLLLYAIYFIKESKIRERP